MNKITQALSRALSMMFTPRVWLLIWKPALLSVLFWLLVAGLVFWIWGNDISQWRESMQHSINNRWAGEHWWENILNMLLMVLTVIVFALLFVVLTVVWALVFVSSFGMSRINRVVADKYFANLQSDAGLTLRHSIAHTFKWTLWFAFFWTISIPLYFVLGAGALVHGAIVARYNQKVFTMDALADHATRAEFERIAREHNFNLFVLGVVITLLGAVPTFFWVGSIFGAVLLPVTAFLSVLTFTALFTFCGLAYSCYCLQVLSEIRGVNT